MLWDTHNDEFNGLEHYTQGDRRFINTLLFKHNIDNKINYDDSYRLNYNFVTKTDEIRSMLEEMYNEKNYKRNYKMSKMSIDVVSRLAPSEYKYLDHFLLHFAPYKLQHVSIDFGMISVAPFIDGL